MKHQFSNKMLNFFENDYASYRLTDGILCIRYHIGICIDLVGAINIVKDRLNLQEGQFLPVLCDIRGVKEVNKSARDYLAIEGSVLIKAVAFIIEDPVSEVISMFYIRTSKPPIPNQTFQSTEEAEKFLSKFK